MGVCISCYNKIRSTKKRVTPDPYIKCIYEIKDNNYTQIINNTGDYTNKEIEKKIKILNGDKKEKLIFKKKFDKIGINTITFVVEKKIKNMDYIFKDCNTLKEIELFYFNTSKVTDMREMFHGCTELEKVNFYNFNISNVTDMFGMFEGCFKLKQINGINNFNTNKVSILTGMFDECKELEYLNLSSFDTLNVTDMSFMFNECNKLKQIDGIKISILLKFLI